MFLKFQDSFSGEETRLEFDRIERLDKEIVGPCLHGDLRVLFVLSPGEENCVGIACLMLEASDFSADLDTVKVGKHPIE